MFRLGSRCLSRACRSRASDLRAGRRCWRMLGGPEDVSGLGGQGWGTYRCEVGGSACTGGRKKVCQAGDGGERCYHMVDCCGDRSEIICIAVW